MADILCVVCNRVNDARAERCWYCQAVLPKSSPGSKNEEDGLFDLRKDSIIPDEHDSETDIPDQPEEEVPDWLARIRLRQRAEREPLINEEAGENIPDTPEASIPEWLGELREEASTADTPILPAFSLDDETTREQQPSDESEEHQNQEDVPTWLTDLPGWKSDQEEVVQFPGPDLEDLGLHQQNIEQSEPPKLDDLFSDLRNELGADVEGTEVNPPEITEIGDILDQTPEPETDSLISTDNIDQAHTSEEEFLENLLATTKDDNESGLPALEYVGETQSSLVLDDIAPEEAIEPTEIVGDTLPEAESWLAGIEQSSTIEDKGSLLDDSIAKAGSTLPFSDEDLPDWLLTDRTKSDQVNEIQETVVESKAEAEEPDELEKAHLPTWVKAAQPIDAVTNPHVAEENQIQPEGDGVLAGIKGVLIGSGISIQNRKQREYSSGLIVSEQQQKNAELFQRLLDDSKPDADSSTSQIPAKRGTSILKVVIALVILAAVFVPMLTGKNIGITPVLFPQEVVTMYGVIQNLPLDKPVLVAADFEAGLAGELNWVGNSALVNLMSRNLPLAVVSTNVVGSAILEQEIVSAVSKVPGYLVDEKTVQFGYLPGGTLGMLSLTRDLHQTLPFTTTLAPAWQKPVLQNVNVLADFGAVIVFTDSAEVARAWVEQVEPALNATPLLLVVSAQAAPLVQPYYASGQIDGYIAGMTGGLAYEQLNLNPGNVSRVFGSLQFTILVVALIVLLGGMVHFILSSISSQKKGRGS